jgi:multidrug efflux pump subunit AcrA (membrane-fusion protein)
MPEPTRIQIRTPQPQTPAVPEPPVHPWVKRQVTLLQRWEALSTRQAQYEAELAKLHATGDALQAEWTALQQENQASLDAMPTDLDAYAVTAQVWALAKARIQQICADVKPTSGLYTSSVPRAILEFGAPLELNPRGAPAAGY